MLPSWCYLFIFILGALSSNDEDKRTTSWVFFGYGIFMLLIAFLPITDFVLYAFVRISWLLTFLFLVHLMTQDCENQFKVYFPFVPIFVCELLFSVGAYFGDLTLMGLAVLISPHAMDLFTVVIGFNNWETVKQAIIGTSIGFFYLFHFMGYL